MRVFVWCLGGGWVWKVDSQIEWDRLVKIEKCSLASRWRREKGYSTFEKSFLKIFADRAVPLWPLTDFCISSSLDFWPPLMHHHIIVITTHTVLLSRSALRLVQSSTEIRFWFEPTYERIPTTTTTMCNGNQTFKLTNVFYGPIPASFSFIFILFTSQINYKLKKRRWSAGDSNPGPKDVRRRWNHGAMAATQRHSFF